MSIKPGTDSASPVSHRLTSTRTTRPSVVPPRAAPSSPSSPRGIKYPEENSSSPHGGDSNILDPGFFHPIQKFTRTVSINSSSRRRTKQEESNVIIIIICGADLAQLIADRKIYIYVRAGRRKRLLALSCNTRDSKSVTFSSAPLNRGKRERKPFVRSVWAGCCSDIQ